MPKLTVDEFVERKVQPHLRDVVARVREIMHECAPAATEQMSHGLPMYIDKSTLAWISPTKKDITFSFAFGAEFDDRYGLLRGDAKNARWVKLKTVAGINDEALRYYIGQAVERDSGW